MAKDVAAEDDDDFIPLCAQRAQKGKERALVSQGQGKRQKNKSLDIFFLFCSFLFPLFSLLSFLLFLLPDPLSWLLPGVSLDGASRLPTVFATTLCHATALKVLLTVYLGE